MGGPGMKSYNIKEIPDALWWKIKERAARERVRIKDLFFRWMVEYAEKPKGKEGEKDEND
jgi:hypothetical protein